MADRYPRVTIDINKLRHNINQAVKESANFGISLAGVIKGANAIRECLPAYIESDLNELASSRLEQLRRAKDMGWTKDLTLVRVPMLSEVEELVSLADMSLNSEMDVLAAIDKEAGRQGKVHKVILMIDLGDLREGFWDKDELIAAANVVEREMKNLYLAGIGTNLGCYGALVPTAEKLQELVVLAERVEESIGRKLDIVSGGASTSYMRITDGDMPKGINHLRLGEMILLARDNDVLHGHPDSGFNKGVFVLEAEVIEIKDKPSYPVGEISFDAFGQRPTFVDRGIRKRAIVAVGKIDYGDPEAIYPREDGIEVLGASSDHTLLDVQGAFDMGREIKVGDIISFDLDYGSTVFLTGSENVKIHTIE